MNESNKENDEKCFTSIYLRQSGSITSDTIKNVIERGYRDKNTLLTLDLITLSGIDSINLAQKRLLNVALHELRYNKTFSDRKRAVDEDEEKKNKKFKLEDNKENVAPVGSKSNKSLQPKKLTNNNDISVHKEKGLEKQNKDNLEDNRNKSTDIEKLIKDSEAVIESAKEFIKESVEELEQMVDNNDSGINCNDLTQMSEKFDDISNENIEESYSQLEKRLFRTLEVLIIKGCFLNFERKSTLIKELSKYCPNSFNSIEMLVRNLTAYDLTAEHNIIKIVFQKCPKLKCLRLSYCKVNVNLMKSLNTLPGLQCLHLEYIYGINSAEEWTKIGKSLNQKLFSLSLNGKFLSDDITGMLTKLSKLSKLSLEDYKDDAIKLFSSISPNIYQLSINNYHNIDVNAIQVLAKRLPNFLTELELVYDSYDSSRTNANHLFAAICELISQLKVLKFKTITMTNMRPLFMAKNLYELDLQFSVQKFINFPEFYSLRSLQNLSLTQTYLTPKRVELMAKAFPNLESLSLSGHPNREHIDCSMFCCECRNIDKTDDSCRLCYENCGLALIEFTYLKVLKLNYVRVRSSLAKVLLYIPKLQRLVVNPFDCQCGYALLINSIKVAKLRRFTLEIRGCFINEALYEAQVLPKNLKIVEYNKLNTKYL